MILYTVTKQKEANWLTDSLFFDTDCISAFLWVHNESLLPQLYPGKIVLPRPVYVELSNPRTSHLKARIDTMLAKGQLVIKDIVVGTAEYNTYYELTENPTIGHKTIGDGEAASIALAKEKGGIVASNNLRDISGYIKEYHLNHKTTGDILFEALQQGLITEAEGNTIWAAMLRKRRKLGAPTFSDYIKNQ